MGATHLHIRFQARAENLVAGREQWDDGRLFLEWQDPKSGGTLGVSRIHSARGDDASEPQVVVARSPVGEAVPVLRLQHLGESGRYVVQVFEITPAREQALWRFGRWGLLIGFLAVLAAVARGTKKPARWRGWFAASIWMLVAVHYVVPGPWEPTRSFGVPFAFEDKRQQKTVISNSEAKMGGLRADDMLFLKALPLPSDPGLRLRQMLPCLRPLMHVALLFFPLLAIAWLVGPRGALSLGVLLSLSTEAAQVMFGFGFGWDDIGDLFFNSLGIAAALWMHRRFARRVHAFMPFPFPEPVV